MIARWLFTLTLLLVLPAISAKAATIAVTSTNAGNNNIDLSFSLGYRFTVDQAINVTAVGRFKRENDGNEATSTTAIFNWDTGVKIFETSLVGAALEDTGVTDTHFLNISPVLLTSGTNYLIATQVDNFDFAFGAGVGTIVTFDSTINWIEGRATPVGSPAMPATATTSTFSIAAPGFDSYFGPNFKFEFPIAELLAEPASGSTLDFGTLGLNTPGLLDDVTLSNVGELSSSINVSSFSIVGPNAALFDVSAFVAALLDDGESVDYDVDFLGSPTPGTFTATLTFFTDAPEGNVVYNLTANVEAAAVPEPSTCALALLGLAGLGVVARRQKR